MPRRMSTATPALIAAAAGVGFAHAILPDHWLALALAGLVALGTGDGAHAVEETAVGASARVR